MLLVIVALLFHFEPLVSESEFLHRHVRAFSFHRFANEFDNAGVDQLPGLDDLAMIFTLELDRDVAGRGLVAVADVVEPVVEVQRSDHAPLERDIGRFVQSRDFSDTVLPFIPVAIFRSSGFYADVAFLKGSLPAFGITRTQVARKLNCR